MDARTDGARPVVIVARLLVSLVVGGMLANVILNPAPWVWIAGAVLVVAAVVLGIWHDRLTRPAHGPTAQDPRTTGWVLLLVVISCVAPMLRGTVANSGWGVPVAAAVGLSGAALAWWGLSRRAPGRNPAGRRPAAPSRPPRAPAGPGTGP